MADTKITALAAITTVDPAADVLPIVDISDTSMAASGTTKKITSNQILGAGGTATLASATITGDLTVDTNVLKVDTTLNRVGIGTATPGFPLHVQSATAVFKLESSTGTNPAYLYTTSTGGDFYFGRDNSTGTTFGTGTGYSAVLYSANAYPMVFFTNAIERYRIASDGVATWSNVGGVAGTAMTLNSTGLGVGVTPSGTGGCLQLKSGITFPATQVASSDANTLDDYEEGTFTPTVEGTSTAGTASYSVQSGLYTKVGRVVTIQIYIAWTGGTGTGNLSMAGLPFTSGGTNYGILSAYPLNIALTAGYYLGANVNLNATTIGLFQLPTGGGADAAIPYDAAGSLLLTGTYFV